MEYISICNDLENAKNLDKFDLVIFCQEVDSAIEFIRIHPGYHDLYDILVAHIKDTDIQKFNTNFIYTSGRYREIADLLKLASTKMVFLNTEEAALCAKNKEK